MSKSILIVDDSTDVRLLIGQLLEFEGYEVNTAAHGQAAVELLRSGLSPGLILLDQEMPVMDGQGFLDELHDLGLSNTVPVVMLSAGEEINNESIRGYIRKPFDIADIMKSVEHLCP